VRCDLEVESAQGTPAVIERDAALGDGGIEAALLEFVAAVRAGEEAPLVFDPLRLQKPGAGQRSFAEDHSRIRTSGIGTTKRPPQERTSDICSMISSFRFQGRMST